MSAISRSIRDINKSIEYARRMHAICLQSPCRVPVAYCVGLDANAEGGWT